MRPKQSCHVCLQRSSHSQLGERKAMCHPPKSELPGAWALLAQVHQPAGHVAGQVASTAPLGESFLIPPLSIPLAAPLADMAT